MVDQVKFFYRLAADDVARIQQIELHVLLAFQKACEELGLTFYLHGGTLLGAKMYQGFIPWDDDIDVSMPRDDYERLLKEGQEHLPDYLRIQTCYNDPFYTLCFAKIRDTRTSLVEYALQNRKGMINGVYIDIFPIDGMKNKKRSIYARALRRRIDMSYWDTEPPIWIKRVLLRIMVFPLLFISANKATQLLDKYRQRIRVKNSPSVFLINRWYYPVSFYLPAPDETILFCGHEMPTMRNVHEWLLIDYPHYQTIPPKEEQIPGHRLVRHRF